MLVRLIRASDEVNGLLREQGKIRQQFSGLLGATGIGRGAGSLPAELYWELLDVDDQGVVTLGASYSRGGTAELIRPQTSFTMPAVVIMSHSRFTSCGRLQSMEKLLRSFGAAT